MIKNLAKKIMHKPHRYIYPFIVYRKQYLFQRQVESHIDIGIISRKMSKDFVSGLAVSVFIPVAIKDMACITLTVNSLKMYLQHPINEIIICGKSDDSLVKKCLELGVTFKDERDVQPIEKDDIDYICDGSDRSSWLYQQLLKINSFNFCASDHVLIWDSDTVLLKPTSFENHGRLIIEFSEELHMPYEVCTTKLIGEYKDLNLGFTCHKILFSKEILRGMVRTIESRSHLPWYGAILESIDTEEASSFSEYNLYSHYAITSSAESILIRHWSNLADVKTNTRFRSALIRKMFSTVSYHSWAQ